VAAWQELIDRYNSALAKTERMSHRDLRRYQECYWFICSGTPATIFHSIAAGSMLCSGETET
jgi:hypothetical protein